MTVCWIGIVFLCPETFAPVLLAKRAKRELQAARSEKEAAHDREIIDRIEHSGPSFATKLKIGMSRPFVLLFTEPILAWLCASVRCSCFAADALGMPRCSTARQARASRADILGILFGFFSAFPYVRCELQPVSDLAGLSDYSRPFCDRARVRHSLQCLADGQTHLSGTLDGLLHRCGHSSRSAIQGDHGCDQEGTSDRQAGAFSAISPFCAL